jgi:hypothetical protein
MDIMVAPAARRVWHQRIGGGEVRDRAVASPLAAWNRGDLSGTLSFGFHEVTGQMDLIQRVTIRNYSDQAITLRSEVEYRFDNDATGVVRVTAPANGSTVGAHVHPHLPPAAPVGAEQRQPGRQRQRVDAGRVRRPLHCRRRAAPRTR